MHAPEERPSLGYNYRIASMLQTPIFTFTKSGSCSKYSWHQFKPFRLQKLSFHNPALRTLAARFAKLDYHIELTYLPAHYSIHYMNHSKVAYTAESYYPRPRSLEVCSLIYTPSQIYPSPSARGISTANLGLGWYIRHIDLLTMIT